MRKSYPSDVSRTQFEIIKPVLEDNKVVIRPRQWLCWWLRQLQNSGEAQISQPIFY